MASRRLGRFSAGAGLSASSSVEGFVERVVVPLGSVGAAAFSQSYEGHDGFFWRHFSLLGPRVESTAFGTKWPLDGGGEACFSSILRGFVASMEGLE